MYLRKVHRMEKTSLPFEDAQVQDVYNREVASPVITIIIVPLHT